MIAGNPITMFNCFPSSEEAMFCMKWDCKAREEGKEKAWENK